MDKTTFIQDTFEPPGTYIPLFVTPNPASEPQSEQGSEKTSSSVSGSSSGSSVPPTPYGSRINSYPKIPKEALEAALPETPVTLETSVKDKKTFIEETFEPYGTYIPLFDKAAIPVDRRSNTRALQPPQEVILPEPLEPLQPDPQQPVQELQPPTEPQQAGQELQPPQPRQVSAISKTQQFIEDTFEPFPSYLTLFKPDDPSIDDLFGSEEMAVPPQSSRFRKTQNNVTRPKVRQSNEREPTDEPVDELQKVLELVRQAEEQSKAFKAGINEGHKDGLNKVLNELIQKTNGLTGQQLAAATTRAAENAEALIKEKAMKEIEDKKLKKAAAKKILKAFKKAANDTKVKDAARKKILKAILQYKARVADQTLFNVLRNETYEQSVENAVVPPLLRKSTTFRPPQHPRAPIRRSAGFEETVETIPTMAVVQPVQETSRLPLNRLELKQEAKQAANEETKKMFMLKVEVAELETEQGRTDIKALVSKAMEPVNNEPLERIKSKISDIENRLAQTLPKLTLFEIEKLEQELKQAKEELVKSQVAREKVIEERALFMDIFNRKLRGPLNLQIKRSNAIIRKVGALLSLFEYISRDFVSTRNHCIYLIPDLVLNPFDYMYVGSYPDTLLYYLHHYDIIGVYLDALKNFYHEMVAIIETDIPEPMTVDTKQLYFTKKQEQVDAILGKLIDHVRSNLVFHAANDISIDVRLQQINDENKALGEKITQMNAAIPSSKIKMEYLSETFGVKFDNVDYIPFFNKIVREEKSKPNLADNKQGVFRIFDKMVQVTNKNTGKMVSAGRGFSAINAKKKKNARRAEQKMARQVTTAPINPRGPSANRPPSDTARKLAVAVATRPLLPDPIVKQAPKRPVVKNPKDTVEPTEPKRRVDTPRLQPEFVGKGTPLNTRETAPERENAQPEFILGMGPRLNNRETAPERENRTMGSKEEILVGIKNDITTRGVPVIIRKEAQPVMRKGKGTELNSGQLNLHEASFPGSLRLKKENEKRRYEQTPSPTEVEPVQPRSLNLNDQDPFVQNI